MSTVTTTRNERSLPETLPPPAPVSEDDAFRALAVKHLEDVRRFKVRTLEFLLVLLFLTPVWIATEYANADGWPERLSSQSNPGDWDPWIFWVALIGGVILGVSAIRTFFARPPTELEVEREVERLRKGR
jgi:hypothetical protein